MKAKLVSIGPVTSSTIRRFGFKVHAEANPHDLPGLIHAVEKCLSNGNANLNGGAR